MFGVSLWEIKIILHTGITGLDSSDYLMPFLFQLYRKRLKEKTLVHNIDVDDDKPYDPVAESIGSPQEQHKSIHVLEVGPTTHPYCCI